MQKISFTKIENGQILQSCTLCKEYKSFSEFHKDKKENFGVMKQCKSCRKRIQASKPKARKRYYQLDNGTLVERECTRCRIIKPSTEFSSHAKCPGGKSTKCKPCSKFENNQYIEKNPSTKKKRDRLYYKANSEKIRNYTKRWKRENRLKAIGYDKRINRHAPIHKKFSKEIRKLKQSLKEKNQQASTVLEKYCLDHIIPIKGENVSGLNVPWNLQILSWSENSCKSNKFDGTYENESWREDL
jgi:hypothetical protein